MGVDTHALKQHAFVLVFTLCLRQLGGIPLSDMLEHELHAVAQSGWVILVRDGDCFVEVDRLEAFLLSEIVVHFSEV